MRLRIRHRLQVRFAEPTRNVICILRLMPRSHEGQRITNWRIDVDPDCLLRRSEDHYGNLTHTLNVTGVTQAVTVTAQGELTSFDAAGVVRGAAERMPADLFSRDTALTMANDTLRAFADRSVEGADGGIARLHSLMGAINGEITVGAQAAKPASAVETLEAAAADGIGHAHLFVACARHLGFPARCASGYVLGDDGPSRRHAWAEAHVEGFGWIGFDTVRDICPQDDHVRVAVGLDAVDAQPVRAAAGTIADESVDITWLLARAPVIEAQTVMV